MLMVFGIVSACANSLQKKNAFPGVSTFPKLLVQ
jgi:hypothetical protein